MQRHQQIESLKNYVLFTKVHILVTVAILLWIIHLNVIVPFKTTAGVRILLDVAVAYLSQGITCTVHRKALKVTVPMDLWSPHPPLTTI